MRNKRFYTTAIIIVILLVVGLLFFKSQSNNVVLKENVVVITEDTDDVYKPYLVEDEGLLFKVNPEYAVGDVLVSGVTDEAPYGYIRKVISIEHISGEYYYSTEPATLLEVFEEAHIRETIELTTDMKSLSGLSKETQLAYDGDKLGGIIASSLFSNSESIDNEDMKDLFVITYEEPGHVECEVGIKLWLDFALDIEDEELEWGMSANARIYGEMLVGFSESQEKEYERELFRKILPTFTIWAGPVPIVITNQVSCQLEAETMLEGSIDSSINTDATITAGFLYASSDNKVQETTEQVMQTGGMKWDSSARAEGKAKAGVFVYLTSLLYNSTGAHIGIGLEGQVDGAIKRGVIDGFEGELNLAIYPQAKGNIVVEIPVVSENLVGISVFEKSLNPLWEAHWPEKETETKDIESVEKVNEEVWYIIYNDIIDTCKEIEKDTYFSIRERFFLDYSIVQEDDLGGVGIYCEKGNKEIVYLLYDINEDEIPELLLGFSDGKNTEIVSILCYYSEMNMVESISAIGYFVDEIYLADGNSYFEAVVTEDGFGGEFIVLGQNGAIMPFSAYRESQNDEQRLKDTNALDWKGLEEWK